ncbi:MAG: hypothetical protein QME42_09735 [bacterium]|nr:hypothetical protein [bacterium]
MSKVTSIKVPEEVVYKIDNLSKIEKIDKSLLFQEALYLGLKELAERITIEQVRKERLTISEAAEILQVTVGEMMELLVTNGYKLKLNKGLLDKSFKTALEIV